MMLDQTTPLGGPQLVFAPDTAPTEPAVNHFNPAAAIRQVVTHTPTNTTNATPVTMPNPAAINVTSVVNSNSGDVISETLDLLHRAEQALAAEMHRINHQETSALDEIKTLVDKAKSIEQREDQLNQFIKRIEERRNQITRDPSSATAIAQEGWLKALTEDFQPSVAPLRPIPPLPQMPTVPEPKLEPKPVPPPTPVIPQPTLPAPSAAEQKIVTAIKAVEPPPRQVFLDATTHVYRSPDGNGVVMQHGKDTMHVSDAELIQAGLGVEDLLDIKADPTA